MTNRFFDVSKKIIKLIIKGIPSAISKSVRNSLINRQDEIKITKISKKKLDINKKNSRNSSKLNNLYLELFLFVLLLILISKYFFDN